MKIHLEIDGLRLAVAQIGRDSMILREARAMKPGTSAILALEIDGRESLQEICLPHGSDGISLEVTYF